MAHQEPNAVAELAEPVEFVEGPALPPPPAAAAHPKGRVKRYEELDGAVGRGVYFRPQRYGVEDLAPLCATVAVTVAGVQRECALVDVSQSGVAIAWPADLDVHQGQRLRASLRFDDHTAFSGETQVGSVRPKAGGRVVGLSFVDFLLDVEELLQLRLVGAWSAEARGVRLAERPWNVAGDERFKALVAELRLYLEDAAREFEALEARLPWQVLNGPPNPARAALISRLRGGVIAEVVRQCEAVDAALRQVPGGLANPAAREWSLRHLDQFWMSAPVCRWTKEKPFGYPGDYEVMNNLYERRFEGATLFAKIIGQVFLCTRTAHAVRCRKDLVKRQIQALLQQGGGARGPVRILSIAAGPALELFELISSLEELPVPLEVVLFEQDKNALAQAWRRLRPVVEARFPHQIRVTYLHDSVKRLLRDATLFQGFGHFDLVYSVGLLDYFQTATGVVLSRRLAATVRPGGRLIVANMVDHATRWLMEWHLDWNLNYRTREEILEIGRRAVPGAQLRLLEEETGINPFFELTPV